MHRALLRRFPAALALSAALLACAAAYGAEDPYRQAVDAFERGAYEEALEGFLQAMATGRDSPALHYNLGVTYYRLERYGEAREAFAGAARSPDYADLAHYNLGLIALRQDEPEAARRWLRRVLAESDSDKLRTLARSALSRVQTTGDGAERPAWAGFVTGDLGYDSNVLLRSDTETLSTSEQDDFFLDVFGYAFRRLGERAAGAGLSVDASAYLLHYMDLSEFDIGSLRFGATLSEASRRWRHDGGAHLAFTFLDGDEFTRETLLDWKARRALGGERRLRLRYEAARIDAMDAAYEYLDGWRHSLEARLGWRPEGEQYYLLYELELNDRADRQTPLFTSLSPVRQTLRAVAQRELRDRLEARAELRFRHSHYRDANQLAAGGLERRIDRRWRFIAKLARLMPNGSELSLEYRYTNNDSSIPSYGYSRFRLMLGAFMPF